MNALKTAQAKFRINQKINFVAGRGGKYTGKVVERQEDGYLYVEFTGKTNATKNQTFYRRVNPNNATPANAK